MQGNKIHLKEATYIKSPRRDHNDKKHDKKVQRIVSSLVVLMCVAFLVMGGVRIISATSNAYVVTVDGMEIATLVSAREAKEALEQCIDVQSAVHMDEYDYSVSYTNEVEIKEVPAVNVVYSSITDAADLLADSLHLVANATVLLINQKETIYVANTDAAYAAVNAAKSHYGSIQDEGVISVRTEETIACDDILAECDDVLTVEEAANMLIYGSTEPVAEEAAEPMITVNVERENTELVELPYNTQHVENDELPRGDEQVVTAGVNGTQEVTLRITEVNGVVQSEEQISAKVITAAIDEVIEVGTFFVPTNRGTSGGSGMFGWPLADGTGTITSRFGWRSRGWHSGVDIANDFGTVIYAAESGTVVQADYDGGGYGNLVRIDHGEGAMTYYAHCDEIFVSVGDFVERGQAVATIGMTGTTTGPHVHFEVRFDGEAYDPLDYLDY